MQQHSALRLKRADGVTPRHRNPFGCPNELPLIGCNGENLKSYQ
ncbi:hypothetical protein C791_5561 [Amycolatopsis azurea DSM 43854]|uniref:Uncharacterized protein n=1 Tax=Amycolatopsis azurea DSM 43854 TaxID=1238180 RepID=M2QCS5_9PSEU|nr:hypothetical protein C791_5561 [Amycolatopsis azurea DSM 43854]